MAMHAVRRELVEAQAAATGLPLIPVMLPFPCSNEIYEERMKAAISEAMAAGVTHMAFGDLFLEDIREYRVRLLKGTGVEPLFPIWTTAEETPALARRMLAADLGAVLTCVDPKQLDNKFVGRQYDETPSWRICLPGSIPAASGESFTRSATGAQSSARISPSRLERSSNGKGSGLPISDRERPSADIQPGFDRTPLPSVV